MEDWMRLKLDAERDVMMRQARFARLIAICGYVILIFAFILIVILPIFGLPYRHLTNLTDGNRLLPLQAYYYYNTDTSPQYELTFISQSVSLIFGTVVYFSIDAFLGLVIFHVCGQLENFRRRLVNFVSCKDFDNVLRDYLKTHLRLIRFAGDIEDTFTFIILCLMLYFSTVFCFFAFLLLTTFADEGINCLAYPQVYIAITGTSVLLVHTLLYCGAGELVTEQCEEIYRAICDLEWYRLDCKNRKILILLMIRANDSFRITAGKMIPLVMSTFCSLLKIQAGYISFLMAKRG